ncbi:MAG: amidohydrolase family protein [Blastocatellia bacterium]
MTKAIKLYAAAAVLFTFIFGFPASIAAQKKNGKGTVAAPLFTSDAVAFVGVNVIPMDRERILQNQTVIIRNGLIAEIGDAKKIKVPKDVTRVDGTGKYLIPGLVDMHTHLLSDGDEYPDSIAPDELRVMVANGVTTVRFMIGTPELLLLRTRSAKGEITAPTIFVASPHLTGRDQGNNFVVGTPDEAREAVRTSKAAGYDFIKITTYVKAEVYEAAIDEAAKQNIQVIGHADREYVTAVRAWKAKQQIEHLDGYMEQLLRDDAPMKGSVSDLYMSDPKNWESIDYIDESKIPIVAKKTVESNPFVNPTQHFFKNSFGTPRSEESIRAQPDFRFYPEKVQKQWFDFYKRSRMMNQVSWERKAKWIATRNKIIKAIHDAGGKIMAGSDTPEFLWLYGFAMHHELKALSETGIGNYAALAAGTRNPQEFLGVLDKAGTVEKGKRADLVLLNANPLDDITATYNRAGVMLKGKYYTQAELNAWLDEIAPKIANSYAEARTK